MNIFLREMKAHRKSIISWSVGMLFMIVAGMAKYSSYSESSQSINDLMSQIPKTLKAILGFGNLDVTKASGFYGMLFVYIAVMATIHASMLGANIISKEERDKTTEFLMVKPVTRTMIITTKLLAALVNVMILNFVTLVLSIVIVGKYSKDEEITGGILILMIGMFVLQLIFLFIGTGIASINKNPKNSASVATTVLLVTYILSILVDMNNKLGGLRYITPFKYYDVEKLMYGEGFEAIFIVLSIVIITISIGVTFIFYRKRDLNT